jgi:hypothetical protein
VSLWRFTSAVHGFIKPGPSVSRSMTQIKNAKGYPLNLILAIGFDLDGAGASSFSGPACLKQIQIFGFRSGKRRLRQKPYPGRGSGSRVTTQVI